MVRPEVVGEAVCEDLRRIPNVSGSRTDRLPGPSPMVGMNPDRRPEPDPSMNLDQKLSLTSDPSMNPGQRLGPTSGQKLGRTPSPEQTTRPSPLVVCAFITGGVVTPGVTALIPRVGTRMSSSSTGAMCTVYTRSMVPSAVFPVVPVITMQHVHGESSATLSVS